MDVPKGKVIVTTTVTTVQILDRSNWYDGPEEDRQFWDDEKILDYERNKDSQDLLEAHGESIQFIDNWNPSGTQTASYGTIDVTVEIQKDYAAQQQNVDDVILNRDPDHIVGHI